MQSVASHHLSRISGAFSRFLLYLFCLRAVRRRKKDAAAIGAKAAVLPSAADK